MDIEKFFNKNKKILLFGLGFNALVFLVIFAGVGPYAYLNRAAIFENLASHYASEYLVKNSAEDGNENQNESKSVSRSLLSEESLIIDIVERVNPAVVSIVVTKDVPIIEQYYEEFDPFEDEFFGGPFGGFGFRVPRYREKGTEEREVGGGSGFFVSADGLVVTNKHVVDDEDASYTVLSNAGEKFHADILAKDPFFDIAVLKIKDAGTVPYISFGDSDALKQGQSVIAIGNALGEFRNSVSVGVISGLSRSIVAGSFGGGGSELLEEVIQTDAAINPGNSGGPLLDLRGNVIGVNVAMASGSENIGFALPANLIKGSINSVKRYGEIVRPYIGVRYMMINEQVKEKNNLSVGYGALIVRGESAEELAVIPGSPADKAGLVENDIILEIDGQKLEDSVTLASVIRKKSVGDSMTLKILSKGKEKVVTVALERLPKRAK
jgi:serine protease Do